MVSHGVIPIGRINANLQRYNGDETEAKKTADCYEGDGYFYRDIAVYSFERDRTTHYRCPDCYTEWDSNTGKVSERIIE